MWRYSNGRTRQRRILRKNSSECGERIGSRRLFYAAKVAILQALRTLRFITHCHLDFLSAIAAPRFYRAGLTALERFLKPVGST
jgi:hypothetical protein